MTKFPLWVGAAVLSLALGAAAAENADPPRPPAGEGGEKPAAEKPAELTPEKLAELLTALDSKEAPRRSEAAKALGEAKVAAAVPKLIALLDDPDEDAQWKATCALGALGRPALPSLIDALLHPRERARWKAENAIKMMGEEAVPALLEALKDKRVRVRQSAAYLLGEIKDARCLEDLAAAIGDKDEDTRWKAATSLTKFGSKATPVVLKQLDATSVEARRCASWIFQQTLDSAGIPALAKAMKDRDDQVHWNAAIALQKIGPPSAPTLFAVLRSDAKEDEKSMAAWILEGIKDTSVQLALRELRPPKPGQETPARPRPAVLPKSVVLVVGSEPEKATVFVDDKYAGVTPLTLKDLPPGHHFLKLTKRDHLPWTKLVELLYPEEKISAKLSLKPKGTLVVTSEPSQADVYIDGEYEGKTPFEKKDLDANPYSVRIEKERYQNWEGEVEVRAGQQTKVHGQLQSKVEGWYQKRLKDNPNDVSCHTELAHYYMVRGDLEKAARSLATAVEVVGSGSDTSGYAGRLLQEIQKIWGQVFQFGGDLQLPAVQRAVHAAIHGAWQRNRDKPLLRAFLDQVAKSINADFTQAPK